jgi:ferredoxin
MRLEIDPNACVGHGRCYAEAPHSINADDEGRGVVLEADVPDPWHDEVRMAARSCPEQAVVLDEFDS